MGIASTIAHRRPNASPMPDAIGTNSSPGSTHSSTVAKLIVRTRGGHDHRNQHGRRRARIAPVKFVSISQKTKVGVFGATATATT